MHLPRDDGRGSLDVPAPGTPGLAYRANGGRLATHPAGPNGWYATPGWAPLPADGL